VVAVMLITGATGAIGFGGLAAWQVTSQNSGNAVSTGSVHHSNSTQFDSSGNSASTTCFDSGSATPGTCGMVFKVTGLRPGQSSATSTLTLTNTGTLASAFALTEPSTPATTSPESGHTTLCTNLSMTITDNESPTQTLYSNPITMGQGGSPTAVTLKASSGHTSWSQNESGVFTFTISLSSTSPYTDSDATCTASLLVTETNS
jgi:hypothetical protein